MRDIEVDVILGELNDLTNLYTVPDDRLAREQVHQRVQRLPSCIDGFPRKEVIQPQLPLRLPCYDFTPIINPTFDGSLPCGLGHRLRVLPTFVV